MVLYTDKKVVIPTGIARFPMMVSTNEKGTNMNGKISKEGIYR